MPERTPRFISQFAALRKEGAARPRSPWLAVALVLLVASAAGLALYDMLH